MTDLHAKSEVDVEAKEKGQSETLALDKGVVKSAKVVLCDLENESVNEMETLPDEVKRRVKALKKLQLDVVNIETSFYKDLHVLEKKYLEKYRPLFEKRCLITSGQYEPTAEECKYPGLDKELKLESDVKEQLGKIISSTLVDKDIKIIAEEAVKQPGGGSCNISNNTITTTTTSGNVGIPSFWVKIFQNVDELSELVEGEDEKVLRHLVDVRVENTLDPMGFKLYFHFNPNDWFNNSVLTKTYIMKCEPDPVDPFTFDGPEIVKAVGCPIDWKKGQNITEKETSKRGGKSKIVKCSSFFNFFSPPEIIQNVPEGVEVEEELEQRLTDDYEIGEYFRERIIPHAVLFYTGEALLDESDSEYEDSTDTEEVEEGDDDESSDGEDEHFSSSAEGYDFD